MFTFLENIYFYLILTGILFVFFLLLRWYFKRIFDKPSVKYAKLERKYTEIQTDSEKEQTRLNYILTDYKKKIEIVNSNENSAQQNEISTISKVETDLQLKSLISEKEGMEIEKQKFAEKNKKLWQQSIAIHKEKERIDKLKKDIEKRHREVTASIQYAQRIQTALLPTDEILNEFLPNHFIFWKPRDIVSGDFYWINKFGNNIVIVAADSTGHGVPGAFMSMLGISFLNETVKSDKLTAGEILENMRKLVKESLSQSKESESKDGMDMALCILNLEEQKIQFAGANNPLFLIRNEELLITKPTRNPIGIYAKEREFETTIIDLQKDDIFYIFSDGFQDQFGGIKDRKFGTRAFKQFVIDLNKQKIPIKEQTKKFEIAFTDWKDTVSEKGKKQQQVDDIIIIGFQTP